MNHLSSHNEDEYVGSTYSKNIKYRVLTDRWDQDHLYVSIDGIILGIVDFWSIRMQSFIFIDISLTMGPLLPMISKTMTRER